MGANDRALRLASQANPSKSAESRVLLGKVHWAMGETAAAEGSFQEALRLDPHSSDSIFSLASLFSSRDPAKAKELLEKFAGRTPPRRPRRTSSSPRSPSRTRTSSRRGST